MANKSRLLRRLAFLSLFSAITLLLYLAFQKGYIHIDPVLEKALQVFLTFILSLLGCTILLRLTEQRVFKLFEKEVEIEQRIILSKLYGFSLYSLAVFITFWKAGVSLGNLTIFVGLVASGFAFAIRDLLLSFLGWFVILNKKPFHIGDYISIGEDFGLVTRIGTFHFTLSQRYNNEYIKVPNNFILLKSIVNKGSQFYRDEIKLLLKQHPSESVEKCLQLQGYIKTIAQFKEQIRVRIDVDEAKGWVLVIQFLNSYQLENLRSAILSEVQKIFGDSLQYNYK